MDRLIQWQADSSGLHFVSVITWIVERTLCSWLRSCWLFIQLCSAFQLRLYCRISQTEGASEPCERKGWRRTKKKGDNCQPVCNGPGCTVDRVILVYRGPRQIGLETACPTSHVSSLSALQDFKASWIYHPILKVINYSNDSGASTYLAISPNSIMNLP
jgi:hypothetical protein